MRLILTKFSIVLNYCVTHFGYINAGKSQIISIFLAICGLLLHFAGITPKTREIQGKMSTDSIEFSKNSENSGQNAYYPSQMATLFVAFPKYSGHYSQFTTSL